MKILVTGGAGFIGSHLVERLVNIGAVTVYDNLSSGRWEFIQHHSARADFSFMRADLLDSETLRKAVKGHDVVFHMAANPEARSGIENTSLDLEQGTVATYNVLEAMRQGGVDQIVFASSSTVYGETSPEPIPEDSSSLRPISLYGASKLAAGIPCLGVTGCSPIVGSAVVALPDTYPLAVVGGGGSIPVAGNGYGAEVRP